MAELSFVMVWDFFFQGLEVRIGPLSVCFVEFWSQAAGGVEQLGNPICIPPRDSTNP